MSLDGLRAWIGVVERKLTMRTRVFLVLVALAVGGAGAAVYLAIDAGDKAVTESDLEAVRDELAGGSSEAASDEVAQLEAEVDELRGQIEALGATGGAGTGGTEGGATPKGGAGGGPAGSGGASTPSPEQEAQLKRLLKKQAREAEAK